MQKDRVTAACVPTSEKLTVQLSALYINMTSFGSANTLDVRRAGNNGVGQFKPIFQVEGNTFHAIFSVISYLIDCPTTVPLEIFTQRNFVANFIRLKLNFIPKN